MQLRNGSIFNTVLVVSPFKPGVEGRGGGLLNTFVRYMLGYHY